jgi:hypothetical protein
MAKKKTSSKGPKSALDRLRAELAKIESPQPPPIPVDRLVGEAKLLAKAAEKRLAGLKKVGLDAKLVSGLEDRASALADAQAELTLARGAKRTKAEVALERDAIALRSQMVADGRYALRDDEDAQAALDAIQEGEGLDDLVQDLRALATFQTEHAAALSKIGVKAKGNAASANKVADGLEALVLARRSGDDQASAEARDLRDRAATHLFHAMSEVRAAGTYAFRDDPAAVQKFRSAYRATKRARGRGKGMPKPPPTDGKAVTPPAAT